MRVLLTGATGQLGAFLIRRLVAGGHELVAWSGRSAGERCGVQVVPVDLADPGAVEEGLTTADPAAVIHAGAVSSIEGVRREPERARAVNVDATRQLARWSAERGRRLIYTSTDLVFDGRRGHYREDDPATPVMAYGRTKIEPEPDVLAVAGAIVARLSLLYGLTARLGAPASYLDRTVDGLRRGEPQTFFEDEFRSPLDLARAADALVRLLATDRSGLVHVGGPERLSRFELGRRLAEGLGLEASLVRANRQADVTFAEPRPADVSLDTTRLVTWLPDLPRPGVEAAVRSQFLGLG